MARNEKSNLLRHVGMGFEFAGSVLGMGLVGYLLDRWLDTFPWCLVAGIVLGAIGGMYILIKRAYDLLSK